LESASLLLCNARGHNSLHIAAVKGDVFAIKKILKKDRTIINIVTRDENSALHLASHSPDAVLAIAKCPQCDVNITDSAGKTVMHLAASRLDTNLITQLVELRASVTCQDKLGNTPSHLVMLEGTELGPYSTDFGELLDTSVIDMMPSLGLNQLDTARISLVLYLFKLGSENVANFHDQTVIDLIENPEAKKFVSEMYMRRLDCQSEHEYAEIVENEQEGATALSEAGPPECMVCSEVIPLVIFLPCMHQVACVDCSFRIKKCLKCGVLVKEKKFHAIGEEGNKVKAHLNLLERKVQDLEDQFLCSICMERKRNVAFQCGHGACNVCTETIDTCHMCRKVIVQKIVQYY